MKKIEDVKFTVTEIDTSDFKLGERIYLHPTIPGKFIGESELNCNYLRKKHDLCHKIKFWSRFSWGLYQKITDNLNYFKKFRN